MRTATYGKQSHRQQTRRYSLVRAGKASWWMPYRKMSEALEALEGLE